MTTAEDHWKDLYGKPATSVQKAIAQVAIEFARKHAYRVAEETIAELGDFGSGQ